MRKLLSILLTCAALSTASGMFINNSVKLPVDRVVANTEAWIKKQPTDPQGYYVLGRIHAMAWAYGPELNLWAPMAGRGKEPPPAPAEGVDPFGGQLPGFAPYDSVQVRRDQEKKKTVTADDQKHLEAAIANYTKAVELNNKSAIYELGLGWILQEAGKVSQQLPSDFGAIEAARPTDAEKTSYEAMIRKLGDNDPKVREEGSKALAAAMPGPYAQLRALRTDDAEVNARAAALLKGYWDLRALAHYRKAYEINLQTDLRRPGRGPAADSQISAEAGEQVLAILKDHPETARENELRDVQANVQKMRSGGMAMTPIVFAMPGVAPARDLGDLVDSSKRVGFDLAGDGIARTWPWLKDGTALLVWDPSGSGKIESGKQLFGSRTWWVCFRNGYEALSVLDDNHDGRLAGAELQGIAVWIDRNGNGISEPGEVVSLQQAGIASIAVTAAETAGVLANPEGITFTSGTTVPTFDWVADQVSEESKAAGQ